LFIAEEAQKSVKALGDAAVNAKYVELVTSSVPSHCCSVLTVLAVRRVQATGTGSCEREAEID
jgi:hypothetical protein